jgi:hypothetical protein
VGPDAAPVDAGRPGADAGAPDARLADAGPADADAADASAEDAAPTDAAPADLGPPVDGGDGGDGGGDVDAGLPEDAGADAGAGSPPAPAVTAVTPRSSPAGAATRLTVTGAGFRPGVTARLDDAPLVELERSGATTLRATVPGALAAGTYDLIVENPDGQAAILPEAFTLVDAAPAPPPSSGACRCARPRGRDAGFSTLALLLILALAPRARRLAFRS